jgi:regulator of protease activity HflC (stomatin/prohibitin superfamily)
MSTELRPDTPAGPRWLSNILTALGYLLVIPLFPLAVKIVPEYQRGVIFRLGRLVGARGPGLFLIIPIVERMVTVDLRIVTMDVPRQDVITRDNVTVKVDAVIYFRVTDPDASVVKVMDYIRATDHSPQHPRPVRAGRAAKQARAAQPAVAEDHRRGHRALGSQGVHRRGARRGSAP